MNQKGVSDVITTVLIILFGIVAVAIVGAIILNQVNKAGRTVDRNSVCIDNVIEVSSCVKDATGSVNVQVTRTSGAATLKPTSSNVVVKGIDGNVKTSNLLAGFSTVGTTSNFPFIPYTGNPDSAYVVAVYSVSGEDQVCKSGEIKCRY